MNTRVELGNTYFGDERVEDAAKAFVKLPSLLWQLGGVNIDDSGVVLDDGVPVCEYYRDTDHSVGDTRLIRNIFVEV